MKKKNKDLILYWQAPIQPLRDRYKEFINALFAFTEQAWRDLCEADESFLADEYDIALYGERYDSYIKLVRDLDLEPAYDEWRQVNRMEAKYGRTQ